jgi:hypothetical protein
MDVQLEPRKSVLISLDQMYMALYVEVYETPNQCMSDTLSLSNGLPADDGRMHSGSVFRFSPGCWNGRRPPQNAQFGPTLWAVSCETTPGT